jgi:hypothetical protein
MRSEEERWGNKGFYTSWSSILMVWIVADKTDTCIDAAVAVSKQSLHPRWFLLSSAGNFTHENATYNVLTGAAAHVVCLRETTAHIVFRHLVLTNRAKRHVSDTQ